MSCTPRLITRLAADYLIEHEDELPNQGEDCNYEEFEALRKDLTLELEAAIVDRWIEWRDKQNDRLHTRT
jgi:hypothetical protein